LGWVQFRPNRGTSVVFGGSLLRGSGGGDRSRVKPSQAVFLLLARRHRFRDGSYYVFLVLDSGCFGTSTLVVMVSSIGVLVVDA
ncbi:hypothetical protein A2U01_0009002, partial [Trifolium medium]|nr:hypothetical protein [Trifolium medium]